MSALEHELAVTYVGGPTVILMVDGVSFVTDPTFDPAGGEYLSGTARLHKTQGPALAREQLGPIEVALISHGARVRGPFYMTMDTNDVIEAAAAFPDALIVPVHHEGWRHLTESQDDLRRAFEALGRANQLRRVTGGGTLRFE